MWFIPPLPTFLPRLFSLFPTHITFQLWLSVPTAAVHLLLAQQSHCHVAFLFPWWRGAICRQRVSRLVAPHLPPWLSSMYVHFLISDSQIHWAHVLFHSCTFTRIRTHSLIIRILCFISMTIISAVMAVQRLHKVGKIFSSDVEWVLIQFSTVNLTLYAVAEKLFFPSLSTVNTAWRYIPGEQQVQLKPEAVAILSSFSVSPDLVTYSPKQTVLTTFFSRCPLNEVLLLFPWLYFPHSRLCEGCALEPAVWVDISPSYLGFNYYL